MTTKTTKTEAPARFCGCGCGEQVGQRATFRPGHDARFAGEVGRILAAGRKVTKAQQAVLDRSPRLAAKVERVRTNAITKAAQTEASA